MLIYLLKSFACLAILLVFYKLVLEKESMHNFKRFYLLAALLFSLIVPALVFTEYVEVVPMEAVVTQQLADSETAINVPPALESDILDIAPILWMIYFLGVFVFALKFIRNLFQIFRRIRNNHRQRSNSFVRVLLRESMPPHTFFRYIFLNRQKFESNEIPAEVLLHEETHARQKHSWDVVFVELLQVLLWFNPLIHFFKKAIKLNHEFLADRAVLKKDITTSTYQNTLLSYLSPDSQRNYQPKLANAINYSSTRLTVFGKTFTFGSTVGQVKKRFTVMKTHTSKRTMWFKTLFLLPLLATLFFSFTTTEIRYENRPVVSDEIHIEIKDNLELWLNGQRVEVQGLSNRILEIVPVDALDKNIPIEVSPAIEIPTDLIKQLQKELGKLGIEKIDLNGLDIHITDSTVDLLQDDLNILPESGISVKVDSEEALEDQAGTTKKQLQEQTYSIEDIQIFINKKGQLFIEKNLVSLEDLKAFILKFNSGLSKEERADRVRATIHPEANAPSKTIKDVEKILMDYGVAQLDIIGPERSSTTRTQNGATKKQVSEYNALAAKYNTMLADKKNIQIKKSHVDRLEYLYGLMTEAQKENAEPFPDFPPMPASPKAPKAPKPAKALKVKKGAKSDIPPPPPPSPSATEIEEVMEAEEVSEDEEMAAIAPAPPLPPEPQTPLDHVIEMAKKDATFYYEGKKISSDRAIELLKKNKNLNIDSRSSKGKHPVVRISAQPIVIEN